MPPVKKRVPNATQRSRAVKVTTPDPVEDIAYPFELGGEEYHAFMPKDFVWMKLIAATAPDATITEKAAAYSDFLQACLDESDRDRIKARMMKRPSQDSARGMELLARIRELVELWTPILDQEFGIALERAQG